MANKDVLHDLENLGDTVQEIIDQAVSSRDFQRLNQTVNQAVNRAVDVGSDAVRRAMDNSGHVLKQTDRHTNKNMYSSKITSLHQQQPTRKMVVEEANNLPVLYSSPSGEKAISIAKTVGGGLLTVGSAPSLLGTAVMSMIVPGMKLVTFGSAILLAGLGSGLWLLNSGIRSLARLGRFEKYVRVLGKKTYCDLDQLARSVGKPVKYVTKELRKMIEDGMFLEGHIDDEEKSLITSNETYRHYQQSQKQLLEKMQQKVMQEKENAQKGITPQVREVLDRGNAFIRQIRQCNDAIPGEEISEKISRMELIVQKIFDRAREHPEIVPDLKKLMDYYLPMTVKLLNAYADMDAQPVQGENIQASKREIENTLDTLNNAFEKLLDSVFRETAIDVSSDITVLHTLLAQEGLTDDDITRRNK